MRAEKPEGPQEPANNRKKRGSGARPKRTGNTGPIGFGSVMRDVKGPAAGSGANASTTLGGKGFGQGKGAGAGAGDGAGTGNPFGGSGPGAPVDPGTFAMQAMGAVPTGEQVVRDATSGIQSATDALAQQDSSATHVLQQEPALPTALGRMSPSALLATVVDESTKLEIEAASKELHVELDPEHLGPLVVRLRKDSDGRIDIRFRARQADAARVLDSGSDILRERLAEAGFTGVRVSVEQDSALVLDSA